MMTRLTRNAVRWRMEDAARRATPRLARGIWSLGIVVGVAPLVGGIGTAIGIIGSFRGFSGNKMSIFLALIGYLTEAITPIAMGLFVAVATWSIRDWLSKQLDELKQEMEIASSEVVSLLDRG